MAEAFGPAGGATRPRWTLTYRVEGSEPQTRTYDVKREAEARSRLAADIPGAYDVSASYAEVPVN